MSTQRQRTYRHTLHTEHTLHRTLRRRTRWLLGAVIVLLAALGLRLIDLQIRQAGRLQSLAAAQAVRTLVLRPQRGGIFDRRGRPLAVGVPARSVYADPSMITEAGATAKHLAAVLPATARDLQQRLTSPGRFVWIARRVDDDVARRVEQLRLTGVGIVREDRRVYPNGPLAGAVIGFTGAENQGLAGVELAYEFVLAGLAGKVQIITDALGRELIGSTQQLTPARGGRSVLLTIDAVIQHIVERELSAAVQTSSARRGIAIVMEPRSGEILALAAVPAFDPSRPDLRKPESWRNPAISNIYEPGSTFKIVLAAAALEFGAVGVEDRFTVPDVLAVNGHIVREAEPRRDRPRVKTLSDVLTYSSNVGAALVAARLRRERMAVAVERFGFGRRTGIDLPGEAAGLVRPTNEWYGPTLQTIGFGQGISVTPLQLLVAASAIANEGIAVQPRIVRVIRSPDGATEPTTPDPGRPVVTPATARSVVAILRRVIGEGTGRKAALEGYDAAGKTGTAQKPGPGGYVPGRYVASFVGFAPADSPRIAVLVVIDEPRGRYYGGEVAAPLFARIAAQTLHYLGVPQKTATRVPVQRGR